MRVMKNCYFINEGCRKAESNETEHDTCRFDFHLFGCYDDDRLLCSSSGSVSLWQLCGLCVFC